MKIAVVTDDHKTISAHFGRAQYYDVFTVEDNKVIEQETREKANHSQFSGEHHHHGAAARHHRRHPGHHGRNQRPFRFF